MSHKKQNEKCNPQYVCKITVEPSTLNHTYLLYQFQLHHIPWRRLQLSHFGTCIHMDDPASDSYSVLYAATISPSLGNSEPTCCLDVKL